LVSKVVYQGQFAHIVLVSRGFLSTSDTNYCP